MTPGYDVKSFRHVFEREMTWLNGFMRNVARYGKKPALRQDERQWSYRELNEEANRLANALLRDGLKKGDIVMSALFNSPEFVFSYLAAHKTGAVNCPVNYRAAPGELALILEDSRPEYFIYDARFEASVEEACRISSFRPRRIIKCGNSGSSIKDVKAYSNFIYGASLENPVNESQGNIYEETLRLYTSGTTNRPKAVPVNSINEVFSAHDAIMHFPLDAGDRTMNLTPWFHRGGIHIGGPTPTLYVGGEVVVLTEFKPRKALEAIRKSEVTFVIGVPSIFRLLARQKKETAMDLPKLKGLCSMGSPFSKFEIEEYRKLFTPNILNGYGTTETCVNTYMRPSSPLEKCSTTGQACIDDDVRLVCLDREGHADPEDLVAKDGKAVGEIIIKASPKSTGCYVANPDMSHKKFFRGFHYTGDVGTWDEDGFITVLGRKDDMIICAGENIYPAQIEAALNEHPDVLECAVIGVPDALHGQCAAAYIVPANADLQIRDIRSWCARHPMIPAYKRPKIYRLVEKLPHTATGKIMHYRIREGAIEKPEIMTE